MRACVAQELRQKKRQLQATTSEATDRQALVRVQEAVRRLDEELADMAVHLGLLQHEMAQGSTPHSPAAVLAA